MVLFYHLFESFATSMIDQRVNHGYLAVDFFFVLSGFVVAYAYDNRIKSGKMSRWDFVKRRLIRLQPMVVLGAVIGAVCFYFAKLEAWDTASVGIESLLWATLLTALLIPVSPNYEIRGNGEMYPLNGPMWSLLFEYIGNVFYIWFLRKLSDRALTAFVMLTGIGLASFAIFGPFGSIGVGWTMDNSNIIGGVFRILFSFSAGMLLSRRFKPRKIKGAFWIASVVIIFLLAMPRIGGEANLWLNGIYESICVIVVFPFLVTLGASESDTSAISTRVSNFLGKISYPLYVVHYPFLYLYYSWVKVNNLAFEESLVGAAAFIFGSIMLAYLAMRFYDEPIRRWLTKQYIVKS